MHGMRTLLKLTIPATLRQCEVWPYCLVGAGVWVLALAAMDSALSGEGAWPDHAQAAPAIRFYNKPKKGDFPPEGVVKMRFPWNTNVRCSSMEGSFAFLTSDIPPNTSPLSSNTPPTPTQVISDIPPNTSPLSPNTPPTPTQVPPHEWTLNQCRCEGRRKLVGQLGRWGQRKGPQYQAREPALTLSLFGVSYSSSSSSPFPYLLSPAPAHSYPTLPPPPSASAFLWDEVCPISRGPWYPAIYTCVSSPITGCPAPEI